MGTMEDWEYDDVFNTFRGQLEMMSPELVAEIDSVRVNNPMDAKKNLLSFLSAAISKLEDYGNMIKKANQSLSSIKTADGDPCQGFTADGIKADEKIFLEMAKDLRDIETLVRAT